MLSDSVGRSAHAAVPCSFRRGDVGFHAAVPVIAEDAALAAVCAILTLDAAKWREHTGDLDEPLHVIEIADPGKAPGDSPE